MFEDRFGWYARISAYWFASSFKWFLALLLLPTAVNKIVPVGQQNTTWGMILAIGAAEATIGPALMGWLSDRTSTRWGKRRPWIFCGALLTCVACGVLAIANTVPLLIVGYLLLQISDDVGTGPYSALIPEFVPPKFRGRASGVLGTLNFSAQVVAAICVIAGVALDISHAVLFGLIAVLHIVCMGLVVTSLREKPYPERGGRGFNLEIWISPWRSSSFRWVWFTRFLIALGFYILSSFGQNFLKDVVKDFRPLLSGDMASDPLLAATLIIVVISLFGIGGALVGGRLADKVGRKKVIQVAGMIMFAAILPFSFGLPYVGIAGLAVIFGLGYGAFSSADWALVADVLPDDADFAKDMGIWQSAIALPQVFNGFFGALIDSQNARSANSGYTMVFVFAAVFFLIGSFLVRYVRPRYEVGGEASQG